MHQLLVVCSVDDVVGEVDQQLGEAALSGRIVAKYRRESGIPKGLRKALTQSLASASIIAQAERIS